MNDWADRMRELRTRGRVRRGWTVTMRLKYFPGHALFLRVTRYRRMKMWWFWFAWVRPGRQFARHWFV